MSSEGLLRAEVSKTRILGKRMLALGIDKRGKTRLSMVGIDQTTGEEIVKE